MIRLALLSLILFLLLAAAPARAEEWNSPEGAQIMVGGRALPPPAEFREWMGRWKGYPIVMAALEAFRSNTGLDLEQDVLSWLEGRVLLAQVRTGPWSPLSEMVHQQRLQADFRDRLAGMWKVQEDLAAWHGDKGSWPATLEELVPDYLEEGAVDLTGLDYARTDGNYALVAIFSNDSSLAEVEPPRFDSTGPIKLVEPEDAPPSVVLALRVTEGALARQKVEEIRRKVGLPEDGTVRIEVRGDWLLASDSAEALDRTAAAVAGRAPVNPRLAALRKNVAPSPDLQVFVDIPDLVDHWRGLEIRDPDALATLKSLKGLLLASYAEPDRVVTDGYLAIEPPVGHPLAALLQGSGEEGRPALVRRLPWSISYVDVYEVRELVRLADVVAEMHPALRMLSSLLRGKVETALGLSLDKDLLPASTGEVALNLEMVDVLGAVVFSATREGSGDCEAGDRPSDEASPGPGGSPFGELAEVPGLGGLVGLGQVPFTVVVGLRPGPTRTKVLAALDGRLGPGARTVAWRGREIRQSADGSLAYAVCGDEVVVAVGPTLRLLKGLLDGMSGKVPPLAELESLKDFRSGLRGRLLAFRHLKADAMYSVAKGILLMLGAEFRAEADHLGLWRDAYAAVTVEPGGLRFRSALYATDQVP